MNIAIVAEQVQGQSDVTSEDLLILILLVLVPIITLTGCFIIDGIYKIVKRKAEKEEFESMSHGVPTAADAKILASMVAPDTNSETWREVYFKINKAIQQGRKEVTVNLGAKQPEISSEQFKAILCADPYNYTVESCVSNYAVIRWDDEE